MKRTAFVTALLASAVVAASASGQTANQHEGHHPGQPEAAAQAQPAPTPAEAPAATGASGLPTMKMVSGEMDMASMMRMMTIIRTSMGGVDGFDRIEGRIAFLRAELRIGDAQVPAWNAFADVLRANAEKLRQANAIDSAAQPQGPTLFDRLHQQERWLAARLDGLRAIRAALTPLYGVLSEEQRRDADDLLGGYFDTGAKGGGAAGGPMMGGAEMMGGGMQGSMKPGVGMPGKGR